MELVAEAEQGDRTALDRDPDRRESFCGQRVGTFGVAARVDLIAEKPGGAAEADLAAVAPSSQPAAGR